MVRMDLYFLGVLANEANGVAAIPVASAIEDFNQVLLDCLLLIRVGLCSWGGLWEE